MLMLMNRTTDMPSEDNTNYAEICGKKYKTVTIGNQTWLAENLDIETESGSVEGYNESDGHLYQWQTAVEIANSIPGWHLPSRAEWNTLYAATGSDATKLKAATRWSSGKGTDDYGFGVLPAGCYYCSSYRDIGIYANFWTSEEWTDSMAYYKYFDTRLRLEEYNYNKSYYYSVRLVKDECPENAKKIDDELTTDDTSIEDENKRLRAENLKLIEENEKLHEELNLLHKEQEIPSELSNLPYQEYEILERAIGELNNAKKCLINTSLLHLSVLKSNETKEEK